MLARPPSGQHGEPRPAAHGVVGSCVGRRASCRSACRRRRRHVRRRDVPADGDGDDRLRVGLRAARPGPGESRARRASGRRCPARTTATLNPAARSVARASATVCSETSGTVIVVGPFDTESVTDEPFDAVELPGRALVDDLAGRLVRVDVDPADREAGRLELRRGDVVAQADDGRHRDRLRPRRHVDPHRRAGDDDDARRPGPAP